MAVVVCLVGVSTIAVYSFAVPGQHLVYLAVGIATAMTSEVTGALAGFLFGVPRAVSSGEVRHRMSATNADNPLEDYVLSPNLAEVSDWLTKLLLGAGLVELTRLGPPIGRLISAVAGGLHSHSPGSSTAAASILAATILLGGAIGGFLEGYTLTTTWYQHKLNGERSRGTSPPGVGRG